PLRRTSPTSLSHTLITVPSSPAPVSPCLFFLMPRLPPRSPLFPYTTLFRSPRLPRAPATVHRRRAGRHRGLPGVVGDRLAGRAQRRAHGEGPAARGPARALYARRPRALPLLGEPRGLPADERELGPGP